MLRAHRQAWCWQDEYYGLTLDDIRALERETQLALAEKMAAASRAESEEPVSQTVGIEDNRATAHSDIPSATERQSRHAKHEKSRSSVQFSESPTQEYPDLDYMTRSTSQESTASTVVNGGVGTTSSTSHHRHPPGSKNKSSSGKFPVSTTDLNVDCVDS